MKVVLLSPAFPAEMAKFTRALAEVGAQVLGIGDTPREELPANVKAHLTDYLTVPRILDEQDVMNRASDWLRGRSVDRVLTNWEPCVLLAARLRERWGMPGMSVDALLGFRDKETMKTRPRAAGLRVPRSARVHTAAHVRATAREIGFPLILKPIGGAGCADTFKVESDRELEKTLPLLGNLNEASCEEYVEGEELTFDTLCIGGQPMIENISLYVPKPLEAASHEWISPMAISIRDLGQPRLAAGLALGRAALEVLGMQDGATHMEWFRTPSGEAVFGEIGCRFGGAGLVDQINFTCDIDLHRQWANVMCLGRFDAEATRKYNVGMIFKRAQGSGTITRIEGLHAWLRACEARGAQVVDETLSRPGTPRRDWQTAQLADGRLMVRHPRWEDTWAMCQAAARDIQLYAQ